MDLVPAVVLGFVAGGAAVWACLRQQIRDAFERGRLSRDGEHAALGERIAARDRDVARLQGALSDVQSHCQTATAQLREEGERRAAADQNASRVPQLEAALCEAVQTAKIKDETVAAVRSENAGLKAELDAERTSTREKLAVLNDAQEQLTLAFRGLS